MKLKNIKAVKILFLVNVISIMLFAGNCWADKSGVEINMLIQETQKTSSKTDQMTLIWWIPEDFWRVSLADNPNITDGQIDEITKVFSPYIIMVVVDGKMGTFAGVDYLSEADIRDKLKIKDKNGKKYSPLAKDKIDADTQNGLEMMKPIFVNMLGQMGENMHFFLFSATDGKGQKIADARAEGSFSVLLDEREFKWRLPLGSLLPRKVCSTCGERLSGGYKFCPYDGTKLK